ncbi:protein ELYS-like [Ostrea edulis]|uniref:protein ELYS-like n=1 Tax=Ostrea edulis TaxID=37623 RepID=UPI0024AEB292|nr:protein ELYS-like [Ostrea edulis]
MRPGTTPHKVSPLKPYIGTNSSAVFGQSDVAIAGVSKDGSICWLVREAVLEVVDTKSSQCLSSWKFGEIICDPHAYITCVKEYQYGSNRKLLVGVCYSSSSGLLCLLDVHLSKIIKTIEIPQKISSLDPVTSMGGDDVPVWALSAHLRHFYGIVAVGTNGGIVYLIDMCLDDDMESDEIKPNKLQLLSPRSRDTEQRRVQAMSRSQHLCMVLDEEAQESGYKYKRCDGTVMKTFNTDAVHVSCLQYIQQIGSLFVGFSFGSYQIWKLHVPVLEYSSRLDVDMVPITHIAYQEPENDPKNFSYIWITRSTGDHQDDSLSIITLYQLAFNKKTLYSNYGPFYEDLTSVSLRFDFELVASPLNPSLKPSVSSRIISCYTLQDPCYKPPSKLDEEESFEESLHGPDLSLSVFVWECSDGYKQTSHMGIFDMNRWYHAQMPSTVRASSGPMDTCSYFSFLSLDEIVEQSEQGSVMAVYLSVDKLSRFTNTSLMPPEQHFYPSALAFNTVCVLDEGIVKAQYLGTQRQVMATMQKMGPSVLLNPKELYNLCVVVGLLPRPLDSAASNPSSAQMKESLLTMALNNHILSFIIKCVQEWGPGEFVHVGCTLKFLLDWVWNRVAEIKNNIDNSCVTLYDWSGIPLDRRAVQTLYQSNQRLGSIASIIKALISQSAPTTEEGLGDLQDKLSVVTYIQQHLQMVIWFYNMKLLPERDEVEETEEKYYNYPAGLLIQSYAQKRQEIQKLDSSVCPTDLLMIDGMVEQMGEKIRDLWYREGGSGLYPPCSLHALLSIYLLDDISLIDKHSLVLYGLLDMVSVANPDAHEKLASKVQKFSRKFGIPFTVVRQVQGFWLLDHKDFEESISLILDPLVSLDFGHWQHQRIVKSLLYQGQSKIAARYLQTVQPALSTPEEVKLKLTVLLASGLTAEALEYQRSCQDQHNAQDLLQHIYQACQQTKTVDQLLQLPMTRLEEENLVQFLTASGDQYCQEILILHYLQRACYVEAIRLNEKLKQTVMTDASAKARERASARNAIVDGFMSVLTGVQRKLVWESYHCQKKPSVSRREVKHPLPLSTKVTKRNYNMQSRSSLYADVMSHVDEMENDQQMENSEGTPERISRGPVFGTPLTPRMNETLNSQPVVYPEMNATSWQNTSQNLNASSLTPIRSKMKVQGASALRLLQTPKVDRKTPRGLSRSASTATPQSILKVRNLINSTAQLDSSNTSNKELSTVQRASEFSVDENVMAVSPRPNKSATPKVALSVSTGPGHGTPKKLRFVMDEKPEELEAPTFERDSPVPSPKKLRFSDSGAKTSSMKTSESPSSRKSALARSPIRPVKNRSPTPESISMSPKNRSKLDKVNRSPRVEDETMSNKIQEEQEMENEGSFHPPAVTYHSEISAIRSSPKEMETASSNPGGMSSTIPLTNFSKGRFTQLKNSPHKASPNKLSISSVCKSPTVKLSQERTALFSETETVKASEEEVSTTTEDKEPIEIDLTVDEDMEEDEIPVISTKEVDGTIAELKDRTLVSAADSSVDNIPTYAFALPTNTEDVLLKEKRPFQRLRSNHQFTFSPPVPVESSGQKDEGTGFDFSKTAEADSTSEMKIDNDQVFSSINGKLDSSPDEEVIKNMESRSRRGNLRSQKFKFSLKSPPSEQKLHGKKASVSSRGIDGSFLDTSGRTIEKELAPKSRSKRSQRTPSWKFAKKLESSTGQENMERTVSSGVPDSEAQSENEKLDSGDGEQNKSRRGRSRKHTVSVIQTRSSDKQSKSTNTSPLERKSFKGSKSKSPSASPSQKSTSTSPSERKSRKEFKSKSPSASSPSQKSTSTSPSERKSRKGSKSKSPSASPSQQAAETRSRSSSKSQEKVVSKSNVISSRHSNRQMSEYVSQDTSPSSVVDRPVRQSARRGGSKSKSPAVEEVFATPTRHSTRLRNRKSLSPTQDTSMLGTSIRSTRARVWKVDSSSRERSESPSKSKTSYNDEIRTRSQAEEVSKTTIVLTPTPSRRGRRKQLDSESSELEVQQKGTPSRRTRRKDEKQHVDPQETTKVENSGTGTPSRKGRKQTGVENQVQESEADITEKKHVSNRHGKMKQIEAEEQEREPETNELQATPSRRHRKKQSVGEEQDKESEMEMTEAPVTPSRRGRRKQTATDESIQESKDDAVVTPSRSTRKKVQVTQEQEITLVKTTPSRKGRRKQPQVESDQTVEDEVKTQEKTESRSEEGKMENPAVETSDEIDESEHTSKTGDEKMLEEENKNNNATSLSFEFAEPVDFEIDDDSKKELEASFEAANSFLFSPPLTRGLSKRLSMDPNDRTSLSSRLSLEPDNRSRPSQKRLNQQDHEIIPPILLPSVNVSPRPPIHEEPSLTRRMSLRGSRSQTPEVQKKSTLPRRGASEPPDNPSVAKIRKRGRKKRELSPVDAVSLIPVIPEEEPRQTRSSRTRQSASEEPNSTQHYNRRERKKAYKLW